MIGEDCHAISVGETVSCLGEDCAQQLARVLGQAVEQAAHHNKDSYHIITLPDYTMRVIVLSSKSIILLHLHKEQGAMIAYAESTLYQNFVLWFQGMVQHTFNVVLRACNVNQVAYT